MQRRIGFAETESAGKERVTKRQRFLAEMEKVVPWSPLLSVIEPYYSKGERVRPPISLERMLRIYFLQQWYGLSDEALEDALYDSNAMRAFAGIRLTDIQLLTLIRSVRLIGTLLKIGAMDPRWSRTSHVTENLMAWMLEANRFIVDPARCRMTFRKKRSNAYSFCTSHKPLFQNIFRHLWCSDLLP
jgi:hypothetical protein